MSVRGVQCSLGLHVFPGAAVLTDCPQRTGDVYVSQWALVLVWGVLSGWVDGGHDCLESRVGVGWGLAAAKGCASFVAPDESSQQNAFRRCGVVVNRLLLRACVQ